MSDSVVDYGVEEVPLGAPAGLLRALASGGVGVCTQVSMRHDGQLGGGWHHGPDSGHAQQLAETVEGMGVGRGDVMHATMYFTDIADWAGMSAVWPSFFQDRSPSCATLPDRVVVMMEGSVVSNGPTAEFLARSKDACAAKCLRIAHPA